MSFPALLSDAYGVQMNLPQLNLARKWRSKTFDQIVGQEMPIRMLKNSLYKSYFFPVYLFSGQRGCGKTTAARLFAAAINCEQLSSFQKNPQSTLLPCGICDSCMLLFAGHHPDFIEVDAASHTGVEHVRTLIEAAGLLPTMGRKRVYLIDEAHMLSKAAFNAFLKILEEPPASTLFIFATTDVQKIIETVRSRCFQLFFTPLPHDALRKHLAHICMQESIDYTVDALSIIVDQTGGSARDALNLLEQVRFAYESITEQTVSEVLGRLTNEQVVTLIELVLSGKTSALLQFFKQTPLKTFFMNTVWNQCITIIRSLLLASYDVSIESYPADLHARITALAKATDVSQLFKLFDELVVLQEQAIHMVDQQLFLELALLKWCKQNNGNDSSEGGAPAQASALEEVEEDECDEEDDDFQEEEEDEEEDASSSTLSNKVEARAPSDPIDSWVGVMSLIKKTDDPLVMSIFSQVTQALFDIHTQKVTLIFPKNLTFFEELLAQTKGIWLPICQAIYGSENLVVVIECTADVVQKIETHVQAPAKKVSTSNVQPVLPKPVSSYTNTQIRNVHSHRHQKVKEPVIIDRALLKDLSDAARWPKTHLVLRHFPASIQGARILS